MWDADDLVRLRVGGLNPYSVPLAGAPWAGYLAGEFAAVDASLHVRVWRDHEVGVVVDGVVLDDVHRTRRADGAHRRARRHRRLRRRALGSWQLDVRGGWSPTTQPGSPAGSWALFAAAGWAWSR